MMTTNTEASKSFTIRVTEKRLQIAMERAVRSDNLGGLVSSVPSVERANAILDKALTIGGSLRDHVALMLHTFTGCEQIATHESITVVCEAYRALRRVRGL